MFLDSMDKILTAIPTLIMLTKNRRENDWLAYIDTLCVGMILMEAGC